MIFDEYNYQTWFRGDDLVENICTYVPFMSFEVGEEKEASSQVVESMAVGEMDSLDLNEEQKSLKVPPLKKICSG